MADTTNPTQGQYELATFAGGCFWCMVKPFDQWPGVISVVSGYTGGHKDNPTYKEVKAGTTGHREAVQITYDPAVISYERILEVYWMQIDPTDDDGQFCDRGSSYRTAVYYHTEAQRVAAEASKQKLDASGRFSKPVVVPVLPAETFWPAEDYHQGFYKTNSEHYHGYRSESGRDEFIGKHWEKK